MADCGILAGPPLTPNGTVHIFTSSHVSTTNTEVNEMLVLSRREQERIRLGDSIVVTIVRVSGDRVRIGIEAPKDLLILRDELEFHASVSDNVARAPGALRNSCLGVCTEGDTAGVVAEVR